MLSRHTAPRIIHAAFARAGVTNDRRLGTHALRKLGLAMCIAIAATISWCFARLHHYHVSITQKYLETDETAVELSISGAISRGEMRKSTKFVDDIWTDDSVYRNASHSDQFWNDVDKVLPSYRERKAWRAKNDTALDI